MRSIGYLGLVGLLLAGGTLSCATSESISETTDEADLESAPVGQEIYPEWFDPGVEGRMADGDLIGYGRALSSSADRSKELAQELALESLRYHIDRILENESGALASSWTGSGSMSAALRTAVASLDLSDVVWRTSELTGLNGLEDTVVQIVEARISKNVVSTQLQASLEPLPVYRLF